MEVVSIVARMGVPMLAIGLMAGLVAASAPPPAAARSPYAFANIEGGRVVEGFAHDAENFKVLAGLRKRHPHLRILVSVGGWTWSGGFSDLVNLMTYDFREAEGDPLAGHHANLFPHPADPEQRSADRAVRKFLAAGVPPAKLVLGVPFYGRPWGEVEAKGNGLYRPGKPLAERMDTRYLAGVMFWEYTADRTGTLLDTLLAELRPRVGRK